MVKEYVHVKECESLVHVTTDRLRRDSWPLRSRSFRPRKGGLRVTRVLVLEGSLPFSLHLSSPAVAVCASLPFHEDARLEQGLGGLGGLALAKRDGPP